MLWLVPKLAQIITMRIHEATGSITLVGIATTGPVGMATSKAHIKSIGPGTCVWHESYRQRIVHDTLRPHFLHHHTPQSVCTTTSRIHNQTSHWKIKGKSHVFTYWENLSLHHRTSKSPKIRLITTDYPDIFILSWFSHCFIRRVIHDIISYRDRGRLEWREAGWAQVIIDAMHTGCQAVV